ncbi:hypothetical protein [Atlantibacter hermannii]|uniref:hypothetical protein n=1 Tax=Atlantibacter hermannii TaxID=565 RepID=UPI0013EEEE4D|nr:hypothetical protein [Atlantibacter hermannii]
MENNKHLVRVGHEFAAAMSDETPIITIAKMVTELASALDVQTARSEALAAELKQAKIDAACCKYGIEQSNKRLGELAAENAGLKSNLMFWDAEDPEAPYGCPEDIAENCQMDFNTEFDVQVAARMPNRTYRVCEITEFERSIELVSGGETETPATDAFLAEVRAQGVEMFAAHLRTNSNEQSPAKLLALGAEEFAAQLRGNSNGGAL